MTRQGLESTIYRTRGERANHYTIDAVQSFVFVSTKDLPAACLPLTYSTTYLNVYIFFFHTEILQICRNIRCLQNSKIFAETLCTGMSKCLCGLIFKKKTFKNYSFILAERLQGILKINSVLQNSPETISYVWACIRSCQVKFKISCLWLWTEIAVCWHA